MGTDSVAVVEGIAAVRVRLDAGAFAVTRHEVVCHASWDERARQLAGRLEGRAVGVPRVVARPLHSVEVQV